LRLLICKCKKYDSILFLTLYIIILILVPQLDYSLAFHSLHIGLVAKIMDEINIFLVRVVD